MIQQVKNGLLGLGYKAEIVPVSFFRHIRQDAVKLKASGYLNRYQNDLVNNVHDFDLHAQGFEIRSIIIVAMPSPSSVTVKFNRRGKCIPVAIPSTYTDYNSAPVVIEKFLSELLSPAGYHSASAQKLPKKWLAVRSGLGVYGRNNICYADGMGIFATLNTFYSDLPCPEGGLHELGQMDECRNCRACLNSCPTSAIRPDRFIIDNERCLTYFNEADGEQDFPEWVDASAHNSMVGCTRCQMNCPVNMKYINGVTEAFEFTEEETALLLAGVAFDQLPEELANKLDKLNMGDYLNALPRNLKALFDVVNC